MLDDEEYRLMETLISHYGHALQEARQKIDDLQRQLAAANERLELMEALHYGVSWL